MRQNDRTDVIIKAKLRLIERLGLKTTSLHPFLQAIISG